MNCRLDNDEQPRAYALIQWSGGISEIYALLPMPGTKSFFASTLSKRFFLPSLSRFCIPHSCKKQAIEDQEKRLADSDDPTVF